MGRLRCLRFVIVAAALPLLVACDSDECGSADNYCEGNVAWYCAGGGGEGAFRWESADCGDGRTCMGGRCFPNPPLTCDASEVGTQRCDPMAMRPGICMLEGMWMWDDARACDGDLAERCRQGWAYGDPDKMMALCVLDLGSCQASIDNPHQSCRDNTAIICSPIGLYAVKADCGAQGMACQGGNCVPR